MKISYDLDAFGNVVNSAIAEELCKLDVFKPFVMTLHEFGITGIKALSFMMRLAQHQSEIDEEKKKRSI